MSYFKAKMHQIRWSSLAYRKGKGEERREGEAWDNKGREGPKLLLNQGPSEPSTPLPLVHLFESGSIWPMELNVQ